MTTKDSQGGDPTRGPMGDRARLPRSNDPRSLYVITLFSSLMPMPLEVPDPRGLEGLAVFRSRRLEDGRERYRLHLGYFDARVDAEDALPIVQKHFPSAWVASAPRSGLGSLDDTNLSEFRLLRSPTLLATTIEAHSNAPTRTGARRTALRGPAELGQSAHRSFGDHAARHLPGLCALHCDARAGRHAVLRHPAWVLHQRNLRTTSGLVRPVRISGSRRGSDQRTRVRACP